LSAIVNTHSSTHSSNMSVIGYNDQAFRKHVVNIHRALHRALTDTRGRVWAQVSIGGLW